MKKAGMLFPFKDSVAKNCKGSTNDWMLSLKILGLYYFSSFLSLEQLD